MNGSAFFKSTVILTAATLLSKVLGSIFRIPLQNIAGDEVLGIFTLVYPVYMVALILSVAGIPIAISRLIASARTEGNLTAVSQIRRTAGSLGLLFGLSSFILIYLFSDILAASLGGPGTRMALLVVSATLLVAPYMAVYRGFFQGFDNMTPTAVSQVLEQVFRVGFILAAAWYLSVQGYSDEITAAGIMAGSIAGVLFSLGYLRRKYKKTDFRLPADSGYSFAAFNKWSKIILRTSIPIAIGSITMALLHVVDSFTVTYGLKAAGTEIENINYLYGIYGRGLALVQITTVFATSLVLPLIPLITQKLAEKDTQATQAVINKTHRLTHLLSWPAAVGLLALTLPVNLALFTNLEGSFVLAVIGFSSVFTSLTILGTGVLQGMGLADKAAVIILSGVVLKVFLNLLLVPLYGLAGAALSTLVVYGLLFAANSFWIYKKMPFTLWNTETAKIIFASLTMAAVTGIPTLFLAWESWSRMGAFLYVLTAILAGSLFYFIQLFLLRVLDKQAVKELPVLGRLIK